MYPNIIDIYWLDASSVLIFFDQRLFLKDRDYIGVFDFIDQMVPVY